MRGQAANDPGQKKQGGLLSQLFGGGSKPVAPAPAPAEADKTDDAAEAGKAEDATDAADDGKEDKKS